MRGHEMFSSPPKSASLTVVVVVVLSWLRRYLTRSFLSECEQWFVCSHLSRRLGTAGHVLRAFRTDGADGKVMVIEVPSLPANLLCDVCVRWRTGTRVLLG